MNDAIENNERLSALADGHWREGGDEAAQTLDWLSSNKDAQARWSTYHLLGDVMRMGVAPCPDREAAFMQRMHTALAQEPKKKPQELAIEKGAGYVHKQGLSGLNVIKKPAANDAVFHWRLVGGLASLMAALVVGWQGLSLGFEPGAAPQIAQVGTPTAAAPLPVAGDELPVMLRDPQLDAFLAAHKQFGGTSAFQKPSGFLSNAVFEGSAR